MSKDIKKALEHCAEWKCDNCPNGDELGSGEIVCRGRLLPQVLEYISDLEQKLALTEKALELAVQQLDDAKDMLRDAGKPDWANTLDASADYFKARAKEMKDE